MNNEPIIKKYNLDPMSDEQSVICSHIKNGHNVVGDACAGSGKSTTILSIATEMPNRQFIQLTYNSMLCAEIKAKVDGLALPNLQVYTYHSLVVKYYNSSGYTDAVIRRVLRAATPPRTPIPQFHVLVIDEAQDMNFLYFKLVIKFIRDAGHPIQLLVLGDYMQGLYEFKGADTRFLTCAASIWSDFELLSSPVFHYCTLKTSYRITNPMAAFVNHAMIGETRLDACKPGDPVVYLRRSRIDAEKYVIYKISTLLKEGASPSDFFVLASSVKGQNSAVRKMENALAENGIPCHVPMLENEKIDERVIDGKVVFSTFHSVKGRQRKYVFIVGFDQSYFTFFGRNLDQTQCPNTLYVAATRATHGLYLIERHEKPWDRPLKFLKMSHLEMKSRDFVEFKGLPQTIFFDKICEPTDLAENKTKHYVTPTELIKFIPESIVEEISPILDSIFVKVHDITNIDTILTDNYGGCAATAAEGGKDPLELDIPIVYKTQRGFYEDVSDLNGIAIPAMYYDKYAACGGGGSFLLSIINSYMDDVKPNDHQYLKQIIRELPQTCETIQDYLYISNVYVAVKEKLYFKLKQIHREDYTWLDDNQVVECFHRLHNVLSHECADGEGGFTKCEIEKNIINVTEEDKHVKIDEYLNPLFPNCQFRFSARVDLLTDYCVWELKCTTNISIDHLLQVVIYAWLWRMVEEDIVNLEGVRDFRIFNIRTGETLRLEATSDQLNDIMVALLRGKYGERESQTDGDFVSECKEYLGRGGDKIDR